MSTSMASVLDALLPLVPPLAGGACIGLAALWGAKLQGRVTGVSGELYRAVVGDASGDKSGGLSGRAGALFFLGGLGAAGVMFRSGIAPFVVDGEALLRGAGEVVARLPVWRLVLGGLLVGAGAGVSNGCTSGHGVCGLSRLSGRSAVAVGAFMASGVITASVTHAASAIPALAPVLSVSPAGVGLTAVLSAAPYALALATRDEAAVHAARGLLFGAGLVVSGMAHPGNTVRFLDLITPGWSPALAAVFVGALPISFVGFRTTHPLLAKTTAFPTRTDIDAPLVAGAATFGAGWALTGLCPAPTVTLLGATPSAPHTLVTLAAVTAGLVAGKRAQSAWAVVQQRRDAFAMEEQGERMQRAEDMTSGEETGKR